MFLPALTPRCGTLSGFTLCCSGPAVQMPTEVQRGASWIALADARQCESYLGELWILLGCCDSSLSLSLAGSVELKAVWAALLCSHRSLLLPSSQPVCCCLYCRRQIGRSASLLHWRFVLAGQLEVVFWPDNNPPTLDQVFFFLISIIMSIHCHPQREQLVGWLPALAMCKVLSHVDTLPPCGPGG